MSVRLYEKLYKYKFHRSILHINDKKVNQDMFSFKPISELDMEKVQLINPKKATTSDSIPPKTLKIN